MGPYERRGRALCRSLCSLPQSAAACHSLATRCRNPLVYIAKTLPIRVFSPFSARYFAKFRFWGQYFAISRRQRQHFPGSAANSTKNSGKNVQKRPKIPQIPQPAAACRSLPAACHSLYSLPQPATACDCTLINTPYPPMGDNQPTYFWFSDNLAVWISACRSLPQPATC